MLEAIQAMWKSTLGIDVAITLREAKVHLASLREGTYDIGFINEIPDLADAASSLENFTTGSPLSPLVVAQPHGRRVTASWVEKSYLRGGQRGASF